jgi:MYXO-CTERM domain-containing protein
MFAAFGGHDFDKTLFGSAGDQVHPGGAGAQRIADTVYAALVAPVDGGAGGAQDAGKDAASGDAKADAAERPAPVDASGGAGTGGGAGKDGGAGTGGGGSSAGTGGGVTGAGGTGTGTFSDAGVDATPPPHDQVVTCDCATAPAAPGVGGLFVAGLLAVVVRRRRR